MRKTKVSRKNFGMLSTQLKIMWSDSVLFLPFSKLIKRAISSPTLHPLFNLETKRLLNEVFCIRDKLKCECGGPPLPISALYVSHPKDSEKILDSIQSVFYTSVNPISRVTLIIPEFPEYPSEVLMKAGEMCRNYNAEFFLKYDSEILPEWLHGMTSTYKGSNSNWIKQQFIKLIYVFNSTEKYVLVCDSDTRFLRRRLWVTGNGVTPLHATWHKPSERSKAALAIIVGDTQPYKDVSFVSHFTLMQKFVVNQLLSSIDVEVKEKEYRPIFDLIIATSEYEAYAKFALSFFPQTHQILRWSNLSLEDRDGGDYLLDSVRLWIAKKLFDSLSVHKHHN